MNPIWVLYHPKIEQKLYIANWQNQFEIRAEQREHLCVSSGSGTNLIENERIHWFPSFSKRQYCIFL